VSAVGADPHSLVKPSELSSAVLERDWECGTAETRYLTHDIHRYSSKYIPQIAGHAVELITRPNDVVLDPMVGSGTTLIEAWMRNRRAIGIDMNPLAVLISRAKTRRVPQHDLADCVDTLSDVVAALPAQLQVDPPHHFDEVSDAAAKDQRASDEWFRKWFQPHVLKDLLILDAAIQRVRNPRSRDLARVALSEILRRSSNAHGGYPNVMFNRNAPRKVPPGPVFIKTLKAYANLVDELNHLQHPEPVVQEGDARAIALPDCSVDAIISHPPYVGSVPYAEYGLVSLRWFGRDVGALDATLLGGKRRSRNVVERFRTAYADVLKEAARVLRPEGYMFLMVGDPVVFGDTIDLAAMTRELGASAGFLEVAATTRRGINRRANKMSHETLLFFQKST
jgi:hypothetical protein